MSTGCSISLTDKAARKLKELHPSETAGAIRFATKQGFCGEGYEYVMDFAAKPETNDAIFYSQDFAIFVPEESLKRLTGSVIDFDEHNALADDRLDPLQKLGFRVDNPNIKGPCPCKCTRGFDC